MTMFIETENVSLNVETRGDKGNPAVILSHSLATDLSTLDFQVPALEKSFYVIRFDMRGHGKSSVVHEDFSIRDLAEDVIDLLDGLEVPKAHFVGVSIGGMIGQHLAIHHGDRFFSATIASSISKIEPENKQMWYDRIALTQNEGMSSHVQPTLERWFTPQAFEKIPDIISRVGKLIADTPAEGYIGACKAISELNLTLDLNSIEIPCLILAGDGDVGTPPAVSEVIHENIPHSEYHVVENASHQLILEQPDKVNSLILDFLGRQ